MTLNRFLALALLGLTGVAVWLTVERDIVAPPEPIADAQLQLTFEDTLGSLSDTEITTFVRDGRAAYAMGQTGLAFQAEGDGSRLDIAFHTPVEITGPTEIAFDFRAEDWTNPYSPGAAAQTMAVVTGRIGGKLSHVVFNLSPRPGRTLTVSFETANGHSVKFSPSRDRIGTDWHSVRLVFDPETRTSELWLDGKRVVSAPLVPAIAHHRIDRLQIGTWHRQNQAYRGLIDNFVLRAATS